MEPKHYLKLVLCLHLVLEVRMNSMYINFQAKIEECGEIEEPDFKARSTTECVLQCGLTKCMNAMMKDGNCYCTKEECAKKQGDESHSNALFFQSK